MSFVDPGGVASGARARKWRLGRDVLQKSARDQRERQIRQNHVATAFWQMPMGADKAYRPAA